MKKNDTQLSIGRELDKYLILKPLGSGGFGEVWMAKDTWLDLTVALKIPYRQDLDIDTLCCEGRIVASLKSPGVVPIRAVERVEGLLMLVFEYMPGGSLASRCRPNGISNFWQLTDYFRTVTEALAIAHGQGIIHRDIKPENILIDSENMARLGDFGIAVPAIAEHTVIGTPPYMAPECWDGEYTEATDVFSLGVSLYKCLTGHLPFDTAHRKVFLENISRGIFKKLDAFRIKYPKNLIHLAHSCLAADPANRPANTSAFLVELCSAKRQAASHKIYQPIPCTMRTTTDGILDVNAEGVCYSANNNLAFGGGTSEAVLRSAGKQLHRAAINLIQERGTLPVGSCIITDAYDLAKSGCHKILHMATLVSDPATKQCRPRSKDYLGDISRAVASSCRLASKAGLRSLAYPLIGSRVGSLSATRSAAAIVRGVHTFLLDQHNGGSSLRQFHLCAFHNTDALQAFLKQIELIRFESGDLFDSDTEAVVVSANNCLIAGSGTAKDARKFGGVCLAESLHKLRKERCPLPIGSAVELQSGEIEDPYYGHRRRLYAAIGMGYHNRNGHQATGRIRATPASVYQAVVSTLRLASSKKVRSIAFPLIGARAGYSSIREEAPRVMLRTMINAINDLRPELTMDRIVIYLPRKHLVLRDVFSLGKNKAIL